MKDESNCCNLNGSHPEHQLVPSSLTVGNNQRRQGFPVIAFGSLGDDDEDFDGHSAKE